MVEASKGALVVVVALGDEEAPVVKLETVWTAFGARVHESVAASRWTAANGAATVLVVVLFQLLVARLGRLDLGSVNKGAVARCRVCRQEFSSRLEAHWRAGRARVLVPRANSSPHCHSCIAGGAVSATPIDVVAAFGGVRHRAVHT